MKTWRVENIGEDWPVGTKLIFLRGDREISAQEEFDVPRARAGETVDVSALIVTPSGVDRRCTAFYSLADADRNPFGPRLWVDILVVNEKVDEKYDEKAGDDKQEQQPGHSEPFPDQPRILPVPQPDFHILPVAVPVNVTQNAAASSLTNASSPVSNQPPAKPEAKPEEKYPAEMEQLIAMGFIQREINQEILNKHNGSLELACEELLRLMCSSN